MSRDPYTRIFKILHVRSRDKIAEYLQLSRNIGGVANLKLSRNIGGIGNLQHRYLTSVWLNIYAYNFPVISTRNRLLKTIP